MKILALQLKRIGDLVLTTPAMHLLKTRMPDAEVTLAVDVNTAPLLPAIPDISGGIVFGPGRGWTPWQQTLTGRWDAALDFTGTDRSALAAWTSRAPRRCAFECVRKRSVRALGYNEFVNSPVRDFHTADHYVHLLRPLGIEEANIRQPRLEIPAAARGEAFKKLTEAGVHGPFVLLHPGTARAEKYWLADRWAELIRHLQAQGRTCVLTGGNNPAEAAHVREIVEAAGVGGKLQVFSGSLDLLILAAFVEAATAVISCDTAVVHLGAAFAKPQICLFGPTNPFHWRPRHPGAIVLSAAHPEGPQTDFDPRMKGAPMERLSTAAVLRVTDGLFKAIPAPYAS